MLCISFVLNSLSTFSGNEQCTLLTLLPWFQDCEDPFYLVDLGRLLTLWDRWSHCLPLVQPFYAVKCNTDPVLLQMLAALGCGFDCASKVRGVSPPSSLLPLVMLSLC